jgi:hypothetical protein
MVNKMLSWKSKEVAFCFFPLLLRLWRCMIGQISSGREATFSLNHLSSRYTVMKHPIFKLSAMLILLIASSCKKTVSPGIDPQLTGKWAWVSEGFVGNDPVLSQSSGVQKTVTFKSDGTVIITQNDSTSIGDVLSVPYPPVLLAGSRSDTSTYQIISENAGCVNIKFRTLVIKGQYGYQYTVSNDTLQIAPGPCLAPFATTYVKTN